MGRARIQVAVLEGKYLAALLQAGLVPTGLYFPLAHAGANALWGGRRLLTMVDPRSP